ncbi:unnamed protein product [Protopolystoma xenopodis]|uniref:Uncharacterized protein n=1 Tax=Protopolystoma xenopodis TaxID=117903 RepID=A0A3S5FGM7_9PLAT|nr:unnamed protein product [Protopolystoma xenopodis]
MNPRACIVRGLFKKETNWEVFLNLRVKVFITPSSVGSTDSDPQELSKVDSSAVITIPGRIEGNFGQSGKCRITLDGMLK